MTLDETMRQVSAAIDEVWQASRDDAELLLIERGAAEDEIAATLAMRDALWRADRERQLRQTRNALESWLRRDGASLQ